MNHLSLFSTHLPPADRSIYRSDGAVLIRNCRRANEAMTSISDPVLRQLNRSFEQLHGQLNQRYDQLRRQYQRNSPSHRRYSTRQRIDTSRFFSPSDESTMEFWPINESEVQRAIDHFGRFSLSTSLQNVSQSKSRCVFRLPSTSDVTHSISIDTAKVNRRKKSTILFFSLSMLAVIRRIVDYSSNIEPSGWNRRNPVERSANGVDNAAN